MKWMKKIASGALALLMAASLTACGGDTSWAYRSENATVTSGMYVGLSIQALNSAFAVDGYDSSKSPFKQDLEGKDGTQWIQDKAAELSREYLAVEEKFQEMGLSFTDEEESSFNNNVELYWTTLRMSSTYEGEGCGKESFAKILRNSAKKNKIFETVYGEGGEKEVPVDELKTIFATDYAKGTYITVSLTDSDGNALTGADLIAKKDEAQKLLDQINGGEDIEKVKAEYNGADVSEDSSVVVSRSNENLSTVGSAIVKGKAGDTGMVTDDKHAYVYLVQDPLSGETFEKYRSTVLQNLKSDEYDELVAQWASGLSVETNSAAVKKHNPKHLRDLVKKRSSSSSSSSSASSK